MSDTQIGKYVIVRAHLSGCHAGILESKDGAEAVLTDARRLWYWAGAASLSQLAATGTSKPNNCKFPVAVPKITVRDCIEIISTTEIAEKSIREAPVWRE